ncbi:MAG: ATP-dependent sacrificial sulfur transferase LarE [Planctomycetales bacterium]|nr:ATP-dependent sacrificial sulfur transferase LarE [Planctomycetales bacterium]
MSELPESLLEKRDALLARLRQLGSCAVALSGGVDSAVVAKAARLALGDAAVAVTAVSPSLASGELAVARQTAALVGIRHEVVHTGEMDVAEYRRNAPDRCYHCKHELYSQLDVRWVQPLGLQHVVNGANVDDVADYRPGMTAADEHGVVSPLIECGIGKHEVRKLAAHWGLPVADKPASPCLSSRVQYGEQVTPERLRMIDRAESWLREHGFVEMRVRLLSGDVASVEVPLPQVGRLTDTPLGNEMTAAFADLGFREVTVDPEGFRSGRLNEFVPLEELVDHRRG